MAYRKRFGFWRIPILLVIFLVYLSPFYVLINLSLKPLTDLSSRWMFPIRPTFENFRAAIEQGGILPALLRSLLISATVVVLIVFIGSLAAYPLTRNKTRFNKVVKAFILGVMMVPPLSILVPLYSVLVSMHGINTYWAIVVVQLTFALPLAILLYTNFIATIPDSLDEAAAIDGCGPVKTFLIVVLPQLKSVTASVIILTGIACWNDYQFALYILQTSRMRTVTLAIASFFSQTTTNLSAAAAAAFIGISPVVICYLILQKNFVKGMVDSAVK